MPQNNADKKEMRRIGHQLNPVVIVAQKGITENISLEIERALESHELIKVRLAIPDRAARREATTMICESLNAELIQSIGQVILLYRPAKTQDRKLSNLIRFKTKS